MILTEEVPLEPELPICDPHHHLFIRDGQRYGVSELLKDIPAGHNVIQTVVVENRTMYRQSGPESLRPVGEIEFVMAEIAGNKSNIDIATGIVAYADLMLGKAVKPVLQAHRDIAGDRFRGIRTMAVWDATPGIPRLTENPRLYMEPAFREGFACLKEFNLVFDAWVFHTQLEQVLDLARSFPETSIVLEHTGTPLGIKNYDRLDVFKEWQQKIAVLSGCPNIMVKLGALGLPACGFGWDIQNASPSSEELAQAMSPYFLWCIEKFGVEQCMFEANFPNDKRSYSYSVFWNACKRMTKSFTPPERAALFHDTATRVYRLPS